MIIRIIEKIKKKKKTTEGIELPIRTFKTKRKLQNPGHIRSGCNQGNGDERKIKEFLRKTRKLLEIKLCRRNLIKETNTWTIFVRYSGHFSNWTRVELRNRDH